MRGTLMKSPRTAAARGFTLIEMCIVMGIIGILATVAIPGFRLMNYRAKAAERGAMVRGIKNSIESARVKDGSFGAGLTGNWNPALPLGVVKRPFVNLMAPGWNQLDLVVDGNLFYSYMFRAEEASGGSPPQFSIFVQGDIDADGDPYLATSTFELQTAGWVQTSVDNSPMYEYTVF
jgi:prepilin-type N-terminal cleavage/methylation domain-containing protein